MGFPLPPKRGEGDIGGYHCWALFKPEGKGWVPVDISEANKDPKMTEYYFGNLTEDRVDVQHRPGHRPGAQAGRPAAELLHLSVCGSGRQGVSRGQGEAEVRIQRCSGIASMQSGLAASQRRARGGACAVASGGRLSSFGWLYLFDKGYVF